MSQIVEKSKAEKGVKEEKETLEFVTSEIGRLWNNAKNPIIIASPTELNPKNLTITDALIHRSTLALLDLE